ncbi:MAG: DUF6288 domain-containing protein [Lentisphaerales bacterium]|nr:DUF6288 domain-containing protein [Lentisphaerales bacterium]
MTFYKLNKITLSCAAYFLLFSASLLGDVLKAPTTNSFSISQWEKDYGSHFNINTWLANNPHPFGKRWDPRVSFMLPRYFINLGPLGINTYMHDQNWALRYKEALAKFPEVIKDSHGPTQNAFEIIRVQKDGPAANSLKEGDLILEIEEEPLKSALWTNLDNKYSARENRGLEIHAGELIDRAEGRGSVRLKILRLPSKFQSPKKTERQEKEFKKLKLSAQKTQKIDVKIPASQYFSIKGETYSSLIFSNITIINSEGLKVALDRLERGPVFNNNFWTNRFIDKNTKDWLIKGPFHFQFVLPPGKWKLTGDILNKDKNSTQISFGSVAQSSLPKSLDRYVKTIDIKIPKIGSFGKTFDPKSAKVRNYSAITAKRLAIQQSPDGSWPYIEGYTTPAFYTSMCGLGLLAEDNSDYNKNIRRAAHYVAYSGQCSNWSWTRGINAMFLAEYYLRTKDKTILPGLSLALKRCEEALLIGDIAGHHYHNPGYGGSGQVSGSGTIACALALAEHTPAEFTRGTALKMMEAIQALAIRGTVPYGRSSGRSVQKKEFDLNLRWGGQTSTAGAAPYFMANKISGGSRFFDAIVSKRFKTAPYGDADGGHGTHTIPFTLGSIAISLCDPEAHKRNMEAFIWKLTTHRGYDGLIVNNSNPMEFHSGEGVMGKPWWSTGAYLILFNAHKRNLGITGKAEYMAKSHRELPLIHDADLKAYRMALRQWSTVHTALGKSVPRSLTLALKELLKMEKNAHYGMNVISFFKKYALKCAKDISHLRLKDQQLKNYCLEIILGVSHDIYLDQYNWNLKDHEKRKLLQKAKATKSLKEYEQQTQSVTLKIDSKTFFTDYNKVLPMTVQSDNPLPKFISKGKLQIRDAKGRQLKGLPKYILLDNSQLVQEFNLPDMKGVDKLYAHFIYDCAGITINYKKELAVNHENNSLKHHANIRSLWLPGTLVDYHKGWKINFKLPSGIIYHGSNLNHPLHITDYKGNAFKDYILRWGSNQANYPVVMPLTKGNHAKFLVSAGSKHEGFVQQIKVADPEYGTIKDISYKLTSGKMQKGESWSDLKDNDPETHVTLYSDKEGIVSFEFTTKKTSLEEFYLLVNRERKDDIQYKIESYSNGKWQEFNWGKLQAQQAFQSIINSPEASKYRMTLRANSPYKIDIFELRFY